MLKSKKIILAAKIFVCLVLSELSLAGGIPVFDGINVSQNTMSAIEEVAQTAKQIEQYTLQLEQYVTQLKQYEDMILNSTAPLMYVWDQAQTTMNNIRTVTDTLTALKAKYTNLNNYLNQFKDIDFYETSPCFNGGGCTAAQFKALQDLQDLGSKLKKDSNDAVFRGLDIQQNNIIKEASNLRKIQAAASGAKGRLEALGYTNQLLSNLANQQLQIRSLLITQQNAEATRYQYMYDEEARRVAEDRQYKAGKFVKSSGIGW
ncbi:MAG TPA: P-type conjugative transfer protein TrbJ [Aeromonadales bacterium]|nr:P-type conjugative transfer protein TrbJ [Aeromonadales bacterium]